MGPFTAHTMYNSSISSMEMEFCYITELTNAMRPRFNLLRDIILGKTAGAKSSSKMTFALNNDVYASTSKQLPGRGKKIWPYNIQVLAALGKYPYIEP